MVPKPLDRPGDDLVSNVLIGIPLILRRIEKAQAGEVGLGAGVNMLRRLSGAAWIDANRGVERGDADIVIGKRPFVETSPPEINNAHAVGLADGLERPLPDPDPIRVVHKPKIRERVPDLTVLLSDG
jgi:hypothetical protein